MSPLITTTNQTLLKNMGFGFSPTLWFACKLCRKTFPDTNQLLVHKTESHLRDCINIKCVLFEEKLLDHELTPSDLDLYPQYKSQEEPQNQPYSNTAQNQEAQGQQNILKLPENKRKLPTETSTSRCLSKKLARCQNQNPSVGLDTLSKQKLNTYPASSKKNTCDSNPTIMTANDVSSTLNCNRKTNLKPNFEYVVKIEESGVHATLLLKEEPKQNSEEFLQENRPQDFLSFLVTRPNASNNASTTTTRINEEAEIVMNDSLREDFEEEPEIEERDPFGDLNADPLKTEPEPPEPEKDFLDQEFPSPVILSSCTIPHKNYVTQNINTDSQQQYLAPEVIDLETDDDDDAFQPGNVVVTNTASDRPFSCPICPSSFRSKHNLNSHKRVHSERRPFPCPYCPIACKTNASLRYHLITHGHPTDHSCRYCGKSFRSEKSAGDHERATHTGDRPYKCEVESCPCFFASRSALTMHTRVKHCAELGLEQFLCTVCGRAFGLKSYLTRHLVIHHSSTKPFKCLNPNCKSSYKFKWELNAHLAKCRANLN